jgi:hypothetical protein
MKKRKNTTSKKTQKAKRTKRGNPLVELLAAFLNLDVARAVDDMKRGAFHKYQSWPRNGIPDGITADDRKHYEELEGVVRLLDELHIQQPGPLVDQLKRLQDEVRKRLQPIIERDETGIRWAMESLVEEVNMRQFRDQLALYAHGVGLGPLKEWSGLVSCNPERPNDVDAADPALFVHQRRLKIGNHEYVVKPVFPRPAARDNSPNYRFDLISNRLYWFLRQILVDATIGTLKMCAECKKYFAAHDSKQVCCDHACYLVKNGRGKSGRAKRSKLKAREIEMIGRFRDSIEDKPRRTNDILRVLGSGNLKMGREAVQGWGTRKDRDVWKRLPPRVRKLISDTMSAR